MLINFKDFVPEIKDEGGFFTTATVEQLSEPLERANSWITKEKIDVINIETVALPNIHQEEGSSDTQLRASGDYSTYWYQFIRIWYRS